MTAAAPPPFGGLEALEAALGAAFRDRRLLQGALTHQSFRNEVSGIDLPDNERLEYLGDAVIDFLAAEHLFRNLPQSREGELTALRAALVCEPSLAGFARQVELGTHLRLGRGEDASGGRERSPLLCDAFESVVGALFLDQGLDACRPVIERFIAPALVEILESRAHKDAKSRFQELAQRLWQATPHYVTVGAEGPDHARTFQIEVRVADQVWGRGSGRSKALAAQAAAHDALRGLEASMPEAAGG
jgi:ribonuclease-3